MYQLEVQLADSEERASSAAAAAQGLSQRLSQLVADARQQLAPAAAAGPGPPGDALVPAGQQQPDAPALLAGLQALVSSAAARAAAQQAELAALGAQAAAAAGARERAQQLDVQLKQAQEQRDKALAQEAALRQQLKAQAQALAEAQAQAEQPAGCAKCEWQRGQVGGALRAPPASLTRPAPVLRALRLGHVQGCCCPAPCRPASPPAPTPNPPWRSWTPARHRLPSCRRTPGPR